MEDNNKESESPLCTRALDEKDCRTIIKQFNCKKEQIIRLLYEDDGKTLTGALIRQTLKKDTA